MGAEPIGLAVPRRYEALAFILREIVLHGISPTYDEIGLELGVVKARARELVKQLIIEGIVERPLGKQRSFRIRDVARAREIVVHVLNRLGWADAIPLGDLQQPPCTHEQLALLAPFEHLPDVD